MEDKILYQLECGLIESNIYCFKRTYDSELKEIYSNTKLNIKIYLRFSKKSSTTLAASSFVYEQTFSEAQDIVDFLKRSRENLNSFLEVLKLVFNTPNTKLGSISLNHPSSVFYGAEFSSLSSFERGVIVTESLESISQAAEQYLRKYSTYSLSNTLEYVARYNAIQEIKDPVLKLINFEALVEYIEDSLGVDKKKRKNNNGLINHPSYEWAKATRDLAAHGVIGIDKRINYTADKLNNKLGLLKKKHYFSRKEHLNLVREAVQVYSQELYFYLSSLLV